MILEKYRPKKFSDMVGMKHVIQFLQSKISSSDGIPHLLLHGEPGCGKTTCSYVLANEILGDNKESNFFEFNASHDNGVDFVRKELSLIAKRRPLGVPYKIVLLDEADQMTAEAQACCRRLIESTSGVTRFILTANYPNKLIPAIVSRFKSIEFKKASYDDLLTYVNKICTLESISISLEDKKLIASNSDGDYRKILNSLGDTNALLQLNMLDKLSLDDITKLSQEKKMELVFSCEPDVLFNSLWEKVKKEQKYKFIPLFADCCYKISNSAHKTVFLANLVDKLV